MAVKTQSWMLDAKGVQISCTSDQSIFQSPFGGGCETGAVAMAKPIGVDSNVATFGS